MATGQLSVPGSTKGYIYRRIDTQKNNDISFDFRNVKFRRWAIDVSETFNMGNTYDSRDLVNDGSGNLFVCIKNNTLGHYLYDTNYWIRLQCTNGSYISSRGGDVSIGGVNFPVPDENNYVDFHLWANESDYESSFSNTIKFGVTQDNDNDLINNNDNDLINNNNNVILSGSFQNNIIEDYFYENTIENNFRGNKITNSFKTNYISNNFYGNEIKSNFYGNLISNDFSMNYIDEYFNSNLVGNNFYTNKVKDNMSYNVVGDSFQNNVVGKNFQNNVICDNFQNNNIGTENSFNVYGALFSNNSSGINNNNNIIGNNSYNNKFDRDFNNNTTDSSFSNNNINGRVSGVNFSGFTDNTDVLTESYPFKEITTNVNYELLVKYIDNYNDTVILTLEDFGILQE